MAEARLNGTRALLVEDEPLLRKRIGAYLGKLEVEVTAVGTLAEARRALAGLEFDLALFDIHLPDGSSLSLLEEKLVPASVATVVMTSEGGVAGAVQAIRLGALDYLAKPFELEELSVRLARARRDRQAGRGASFRREQQEERDAQYLFFPGMAGVKEQLEKIVAADRRALRGPSPVLIEGETGTGKTSLARWIHGNGPRAEGPLIELNCSALPEALAESELFGHERGAFTDAREARIGLLEAAEGGTLFLDELPSLSPTLQAKVLTALEDRTIRRVGGNRTVTIDVRIIAATSLDLRGLVAAGKFREDLLHRLDMLRVRLPPLRERGGDLLLLAEALAARIAKNYGREPRPIPPIGRERLQNHRWPGNVRELANEIERSLIFDGDRLEFESLARASGGPNETGGWLNPGFAFPPSGFSLEEAIDRLVLKALQQSGRNVSAAARLLGVPRDFVRHRLKTRMQDVLGTDSQED